MTNRSLFRAVVLVLALSGGTAAHAQTWVITASGTISTGNDTTGLFGQVGENLAGLTYKEIISTNVDPAFWSTVGNGFRYGAGPAFTTTIELKGQTWTFIAPSLSNGTQLLQNGLSQGVAHGADAVVTYGEGSIQLGGATHSVASGITIFSDSTPFVSSLDFYQKLTIHPNSSFGAAGYFNFGDNGADTKFWGNVSEYKLNTAAVPEPETYTMLLAGLGLGASIARRRQRRA